MPKNKSINLLPQKEFESSIVGRVLKWAMGTFRIIVIITEMVVMGAFLSRFWLDARNSDLNDSIKIKGAEITSQSDFEKQFRDIQSKLDIFKQMSNAPKSSDKLSVIASKIPGEVTLNSVSVLGNSIQIKGASISELGIAQFISNLKSEKSFKKVELGQANSSEENPLLTVFTIAINY